MPHPAQLPMALPFAPAFGRSDFVVSPANAQALATLDSWRDWPQRKLLLTGPEGAGKTHLAHVWAAESCAGLVAGGQLAHSDLPTLTAWPALVVEDADSVAGDTRAEEALFHLHNMIQAARTPLLLTAQAPPRDWGLCLPDLASRLQACATVALRAPDDALLAAVLEKMFSDRRIPVPDTLIPYLLVRMDRSFAAAQALVEALDARSIAAARPVTRALAAEVLGKRGIE